MTDNQVNCRAKFKMVEKPDSPGESSTSSDHTSLNTKPKSKLVSQRVGKVFLWWIWWRPLVQSKTCSRQDRRQQRPSKMCAPEKNRHFSWVSSNLSSVSSLTSSVLLPGPPPLSLNSWPVEKTEMPMLCARANCTEAWIAYCTRIMKLLLVCSNWLYCRHLNFQAVTFICQWQLKTSYWITFKLWPHNLL